MKETKSTDVVKIEEKKDVAVMMLQEALQKGLDTETIEKLLDLRERIRQEQARQSFISALSQFQNELPPIEKDKTVLNTNGTVRYRYASFDKIISTIKPLLNKYGLSYRFETAFEPNIIIVTCIVQHVDGHSERTSFKLPIDQSFHMNLIQKYGASLTYGKRYSLTLALGLATEEDTDAVDSEMEEKPAEVIHQSTQQQTGDVATESQIKAIHAIMNSKGIKEENKYQIASSILGKEIASFKDLTKKEASQLIDALKQEPF